MVQREAGRADAERPIPMNEVHFRAFRRLRDENGIVHEVCWSPTQECNVRYCTKVPVAYEFSDVLAPDTPVTCLWCLEAR